LENIRPIAKLKRIIEGVETDHIIKYVQDHPGTTMDAVAKDLQEQKICSRLTTLKVIETLLSVGIIKDQRKGRYFHSLYYDKNYDINEFHIFMLISSLDGLKKIYSEMTEDEQYDKLFDELKAHVIRFKHKPRKPAKLKSGGVGE
jgi:hypothetical protein